MNNNVVPALTQYGFPQFSEKDADQFHNYDTISDISELWDYNTEQLSDMALNPNTTVDRFFKATNTIYYHTTILNKPPTNGFEPITNKYQQLVNYLIDYELYNWEHPNATYPDSPHAIENLFSNSYYRHIYLWNENEPMYDNNLTLPTSILYHFFQQMNRNAILDRSDDNLYIAHDIAFTIAKHLTNPTNGHIYFADYGTYKATPPAIAIPNPVAQNVWRNPLVLEAVRIENDPAAKELPFHWKQSLIETQPVI